MAQKGVAGREPPRTGGTEDARLVAPSLGQRHSVEFRRRVRRIHAAGPRPLGELLLELIVGTCPACRRLVLDRVERYGELDPNLARWLGADDWLADRDLIRLVAGGRP